MEFHTLVGGLERAGAFLLVAFCAIGVAGMLYSMGVFQRLSAESELEEQWSAACAARLDEAICDETIDEHRWDCFKASRVTRGSGRAAQIAYDPEEFPRCMDEYANRLAATR